jgi:hypothetical protein
MGVDELSWGIMFGELLCFARRVVSDILEPA